MYLQTATSLDQIVSFGMDPLIELMYFFEDEIQDTLPPGSREAILWTSIKGQALRVKEAAERINETNSARLRHTGNKQ